ncbi:MAG: cyclic di-GMP phosphodiesterase [Actinomycetota bacterium]|jgi:putative two-component system response regulator|nr:cyclic di-GMP phosphodiesterase [Actinomycetota bacterium]
MLVDRNSNHVALARAESEPHGTLESEAGSSPLQQRILVVDDEPAVRAMLMRLLKRAGYECADAADSNEAKRLVAKDDFALVLTDMNMPGDSGMDLVAALLVDDPDLATIMVTGVDDTLLAKVALEIGAYGYVIKPFESNEILISVANALRRRDLEMENRRHRDTLEQMVAERTRELWSAVNELEQTKKDLRVSQAETIERLAIAAEYRDDETARHIHRMSRYSELLVRRTGGGDDRAEFVRLASIMHDVGKIGIPDHILLKPGKLTPEEYATMQGHAEIGHRILVDSNSALLDLAASIALTHHEKIDGSGYPSGLAGDEIPFEGRVAAIADVFDALTTDRIYRRAFPIGEAVEMMKAGRGSHFDADLLDVFLDSLPLVLEIKEAYGTS